MNAVKKKSAEEIAAAYKSEPWWYDVRGFFILTFAYNSTLPQQLRFFGVNMATPHLEVACGSGTLLSMILGWRRRHDLPPIGETVGVDYAESMLGGAIRRFKRNPEMRFELADAASMDLPSNYFASANLANAFHCIPDAEGALREVHRVLRPGGKLAMNVLLYPRGNSVLARIAGRINEWGIKKGILVTPYRQPEVIAMAVAVGFSVAHQAVSGNCLNVVLEKSESP